MPQKFGLVFNSIPEKCVDMMSTHHVYLVDDSKRGWHNKNGAATSILIEGENYQALRILEYTHAGKIDCIYIDPPYNTGNKDFVYNDAFVDDEDTYRHSKWLSFMENRLVLAKKLLSDKGVIFISIDDNEMAHLKLLCDDVFGEQNFIANMVWKKKDGGAHDSDEIAIEHEYILVYAKNKELVGFNGIPSDKLNDENYYRYEDRHVKTRGRYRIEPLDRSSIQYSLSMDFDIPSPTYSKIFPGGNIEQGNGKTSWRWGKDKVEWGLENDFLLAVSGDQHWSWDLTAAKMNKRGNGWTIWQDGQRNKTGEWKIYSKQYQFVDNENKKIKRTNPLRTIIDDVFTKTANYELKALDISFNYAKPVELIKRLLFVATQKNSIVLDFFAGSGTTGQAVAELNKEDGGTRQFILTTNNDKSDRLPNGIARDCTYPRLEKTIKEETNLRYLRIEKLKHSEKHKSDTAKIAQLAMKNRMLPILSLAYNCHTVVEESERHIIFTNSKGKFFLGVLFNDLERLRPIDSSDLTKLRKTLKGYGKNELLVNDAGAGYAGEYFEFVKAGN